MSEPVTCKCDRYQSSALAWLGISLAGALGILFGAFVAIDSSAAGEFSWVAVVLLALFVFSCGLGIAILILFDGIEEVDPCPE